MPLYNLQSNRNNIAASIGPRKRPTISQEVKLYHDSGVQVEETIQMENVHTPSNRTIYGYINCSENPPFPEARRGHSYIISESGMIGGIKIEKGAVIECTAEYSPEGYDVSIHKNWFIGGAITGTSSEATTENISNEIRQLLNEYLNNASQVKPEIWTTDFRSHAVITNIPAGSVILSGELKIHEVYPQDTIFYLKIDSNVVAIITDPSVVPLQLVMLEKTSNVEIFVYDYTGGNATLSLTILPPPEIMNIPKMTRFSLHSPESNKLLISKGEDITDVIFVFSKEFRKNPVSVSLCLDDAILMTISDGENISKNVEIPITVSGKLHVVCPEYKAGECIVFIERKTAH